MRSWGAAPPVALVRPLTVSAVAGFGCAIGAAAVWLMLSRRGSLEDLATTNELWFVAFLLMWTAGLGLSVIPQRSRQSLNRTCAGFSFAGLAVSGLTLFVSPGVFVFLLVNAIDAIFT